MAAKQSAEMRKALKLYAGGAGVTDAAKRAGVNRTALHYAITQQEAKKVLASVG